MSQNRVFSGPGSFFVPATLFTLRIPFDGDRNLLRYPASGFGGPIPAELAEDAIFLTYRAEKPDAQAIQREFDNQIARIETALEFVRGPAAEWNTRLPALIRPQVEKRHWQTQRNHTIDLGYAKAPAPVPLTAAAPPKSQVGKYDFFLSHAWEDKERFARPLYHALIAAGASVWFDEAVLNIGDSLRRKIDEGLARFRYGIVVISPSFLNKEWPQRELDALVALEVQSGKTKILPIWHEIDKATLIQRSPTLADKVAGQSSEGIPALVQKILAVIS
ncbi:MAG: toll/interleukin-1 receptor domain-containing protein [Bryobacteraceae bacterium]